jgi:hypothetical protein
MRGHLTAAALRSHLRFPTEFFRRWTPNICTASTKLQGSRLYFDVRRPRGADLLRRHKFGRLLVRVELFDQIHNGRGLLHQFFVDRFDFLAGDRFHVES